MVIVDPWYLSHRNATYAERSGLVGGALDWEWKGFWFETHHGGVTVLCPLADTLSAA